jgi:anti-sigma factor RsiW
MTIAMNTENPSLESNAIDEELVAYLDGELSREQALKIERRMADDPKYAARLNQLQRAWDLLDTLNRTEADDDFVHSTVEMVAVHAAEEAKTQKLRVVRRRNFGWVAMVVFVLAVAGTTYGLIRHQLAQPNRALVRDLPLIERVDDYQNIDSVDFVKQLAKENLFAAEVDDGP